MKRLLEVLDDDGVRLVVAYNVSDLAVGISHAVNGLIAARETPPELLAIATRYAAEFDAWIGAKSPPIRLVRRAEGGQPS